MAQIGILATLGLVAFVATTTVCANPISEHNDIVERPTHHDAAFEGSEHRHEGLQSSQNEGHEPTTTLELRPTHPSYKPTFKPFYPKTTVKPQNLKESLMIVAFGKP